MSHDDRSGRCGICFEVGLRALHCISEVCLVHDVVAIKNAARLVPADGHGYALGNSGPDHVANRGASEVMKQTAGIFRSGAALLTAVTVDDL
jgi:hypothetical protein